MSPLRQALLIVAVIMFLIAIFPLPTRGYSVVAIGLAALAASQLV